MSNPTKSCQSITRTRSRASGSCGWARSCATCCRACCSAASCAIPALQGVAVTVTEVRMSPDLKSATAYIMPLGGEHRAEVMAGLTRSAGYLRGQIGARGAAALHAGARRLRSTPPSTMPAASTSCCIVPRSSAISRPARRKSPMMARKRRGQPVNGWLVLDKPLWHELEPRGGRGAAPLDAAKAGHGGTLDPLATGVLPIALGEATKTWPGPWRGGRPIASRCAGASPGIPTMPRARSSRQAPLAAEPAAIVAALPRFTGTIRQRPPDFFGAQARGRAGL